MNLDRCSVDGCQLTATETGLCFYHDRVGIPEITVKDAARILHDTRYKKRERKREIIETVTEYESPSRVIVATDEKSLELADKTKDAEFEDSLSHWSDAIRDDRFLTGCLEITLQTGGTKENRANLALWFDGNIFGLSNEDRAFIFELVDVFRAYARKHPRVPKLNSGKINS